MAALVAALTPCGCSAPDRRAAPAVRHEVVNILDAQTDAWNRGDVDAFMQHYWRSGALSFSSGGATTRGWEATRERYRQRYPTSEHMGRVSFEGLEVHPLGPDVAYVLGNWRLQRQQEPIGGNFSLVVRRIGGRWLIVHDHTSVAPGN